MPENDNQVAERVGDPIHNDIVMRKKPSRTFLGHARPRALLATGGRTVSERRPHMRPWSHGENNQ